MRTNQGVESVREKWGWGWWVFWAAMKDGGQSVGGDYLCRKRGKANGTPKALKRRDKVAVGSESGCEG